MCVRYDEQIPGLFVEEKDTQKVVWFLGWKIEKLFGFLEKEFRSQSGQEAYPFFDQCYLNVVCSILGFRWIRRRILKWVCSRECSMDNTWSKMRDATTPFLRCNWTFFMWRIHDVLDVQGIISVILRVSVGGKDTVLKNRIGKDRSVSSEGELKG